MDLKNLETPPSEAERAAVDGVLGRSPARDRPPAEDRPTPLAEARRQRT